MAKRALDFCSQDTPTTPAKIKQMLSPKDIAAPDANVTVIVSLSPVKKNSYFDGELTDGEAIIRTVGFETKQ